MNDVAVGEDQTVRRDDEARALAAATGPLSAAHFDRDDRRPDLLYRANDRP